MSAPGGPASVRFAGEERRERILCLHRRGKLTPELSDTTADEELNVLFGRVPSEGAVRQRGVTAAKIHPDEVAAPGIDPLEGTTLQCLAQKPLLESGPERVAGYRCRGWRSPGGRCGSREAVAVVRVLHRREVPPPPRSAAVGERTCRSRLTLQGHRTRADALPCGGAAGRA